MYKKKEIFIIIGIVLLTIILACLPLMINNDEKKVEPITSTKRGVSITLVGELLVPGNPLDEDTIVNHITIEFQSGVTYGEIMSTVSNYFTAYSVVDGEYLNRYYEDSTIKILSSYVEEYIPSDNETYKINISTASMDELTSLYGIGTKRAQTIIEYRETNPIDSYQELKDLLGVSDAIITGIKEKTILQ